MSSLQQRERVPTISNNVEEIRVEADESLRYMIYQQKKNIKFSATNSN